MSFRDRGRIRIRRFLSALVGCGVVAAGPRTEADLIDFDSLRPGEIVTDQFIDSHGLMVEAINPNRSFDLAITYDSTGAYAGDDPDLLAPWDRGNLHGDTRLGNLLILAENDRDVSPADGYIDTPDDEGRRPAGSLILHFATPVVEFGLDLIDIEGVGPGSEPGGLRFYSGGIEGNLLALIAFGAFTDDESAHYDPTVRFGNNSANRIEPLHASTFNADQFDTVVIDLGGSGAVDTLAYAPIPEPASALLLAFGVVMLTRKRRDPTA